MGLPGQAGHGGGGRAQVGGLDAPLALDWVPTVCPALFCCAGHPGPHGWWAGACLHLYILGEEAPEATKHYQNRHGSTSGKLKSLLSEGQGWDSAAGLQTPA